MEVHENISMDVFDPKGFWKRFGDIAVKDLPILLRTNIKQSTLSSWRKNKIFPRADDAVRIAAALETTVEYLVTGTDKSLKPCSQKAIDIAMIADLLTEDGQDCLLNIARVFAAKISFLKDEE